MQVFKCFPAPGVSQKQLHLWSHTQNSFSSATFVRNTLSPYVTSEQEIHRGYMEGRRRPWNRSISVHCPGTNSPGNSLTARLRCGVTLILLKISVRFKGGGVLSAGLQIIIEVHRGNFNYCLFVHGTKRDLITAWRGTAHRTCASGLRYSYSRITCGFSKSQIMQMCLFTTLDAWKT